MFGIVLSPIAKTVLILATIVSIFATGYYKGYKNTQVKFDEYKVEVAAKAAEQTAKTNVINSKNNQVAKQVSYDYKNNLANVRNHYNRLQLDGSSALPRLPNSSSGANGTPSYDVLIGDCAETTLQIVTLQDYIKSIQSNY